MVKGTIHVDVTGKIIPATGANSYIDVDTGENLGGNGVILFQCLQTSVLVISTYFSYETKTWHIRISNTTGAITTITDLPVKYLGFIS